MKKIILLMLLSFSLYGCSSGERYTSDRIILSFDTTQFEDEEDIEGYSEAYGTLPPEFVILVFEQEVRLSRDYSPNNRDVNTQTATILRQRIGEPWSTDIVLEILGNTYTLIEGDNEGEYLFFLNNGVAVDVNVESNGNVNIAIGRNLRQINGMLYVMPYDTATWEQKFQWYRDICRNCVPQRIDDDSFRFTFEGKHFLFKKELNGVYTVTPFQS